MPHTNFNSVRMRFEFEFTRVNERMMVIDIPEYGLLVNPSSPGSYTAEFDLIIPASIKMIFSGKNQNLDTILDSDGNIVQDLCVQLNKIWLDGLPVNVHASKISKFTRESGESQATNYIGFNGELVMHLDHDNAFDQIMSWNRLNLTSSADAMSDPYFKVHAIKPKVVDNHYLLEKMINVAE